MRDTPGKIVAGACFALALVRGRLDQFLREHDKAPLSRVDVKRVTERVGCKVGSQRPNAQGLEFCKGAGPSGEHL